MRWCTQTRALIFILHFSYLFLSHESNHYRVFCNGWCYWGILQGAPKSHEVFNEILCMLRWSHALYLLIRNQLSVFNIGILFCQCCIRNGWFSMSSTFNEEWQISYICASLEIWMIRNECAYPCCSCCMLVFLVNRIGCGNNGSFNLFICCGAWRP